MQRVEMIGIGLEDPAIQPLGLVEVAGLVTRAGALDQRGGIGLLRDCLRSGYRALRKCG